MFRELQAVSENGMASLDWAKGALGFDLDQCGLARVRVSLAPVKRCLSRELHDHSTCYVAC
jgi:hypothetical protein